MAQLALGLAGAAVGSLFGVPGIGFAIGSGLGGALFAPDVQGPRLSDLKGPQGAYGSVIPYVEGHPRLPGVIIWNSDKREIENTQSAGKGGPEQTTFTYVIDVMYALAENDIGPLRRVWSNGKLVWTAADDSDAESQAASDEAPWGSITLYMGDADQLPDPTYEAAVGTANAPAYRDRTTVVITDLDLGGSGQIPVLTFECGGTGDTAPGSSPLFWPQYLVNCEDSIAPPAAYAIIQNSAVQTDNPANYAQFGFTRLFNTALRLTTSDPNNAAFIRYDVQKIINGTQPPPTNFVVTYSFEISNLVGKSGTSISVSDIYTVLNFATTLVDADAIGIGLRREGALNTLYYTQRFAGGTSLATYVREFNAVKLYFRIIQSFENGYVNSTELRVRETEEIDEFEVLLLTRTMLQLRYVTVSQDGFFPLPLGSSLPGVVSVDVGNLRAFTGTAAAGNGIPLNEPTLQEVVERQCERAGIPSQYVDATDLATRFVSGMALTQIVSPRTVIDTLERGYFFKAVESEVLRFTFRGGDVVETVPYEALGAALDTASNDPLPITLSNDTEQPVQVFVKYSNGDDDYQDGNEQSFRVTNSPGNTAAIELPLVFTPTEAKRIADVTVLLNKAESMKFGPFALSRDYAELEPTDVVILTDRDGNTYRSRLTTKNESLGVLTFEAVLDDATILNSNVETAGGYNNVTTVAPKIATEFEPLDIPLLRDIDDATGIYWAAGGADGWTGATWNQSADDATFSRVSQTERNAVIGVTDGTLGNFTGGRFFDEVNVLRVNLTYGQLAGYSRDDALNNGAGSYMVGSEVIQARNATLVSEGVYDLTGLLRGCRGTEWAISGHAANERVVLLTDTTLNRQPLNVSDIGLTIFWKAVTFGRLAATADSESLVFGSVSQRPFSPVDLRGSRDSGDLTMTWRRRTRLSTNFHAHLYPLGESSEAYQVVVYEDNTYAVVKRVISSTSPTAAYSSADQTADFGSPQSTVYVDIFQTSATAGRGYALRGLI